MNRVSFLVFSNESCLYLNVNDTVERERLMKILHVLIFKSQNAQ